MILCQWGRVTPVPATRAFLIVVAGKSSVGRMFPITGELIMKTFGIPPGREVGAIKNAIRDAILDGIIHNEFDEAYQLMLKEGEKLGLKSV